MPLSSDTSKADSKRSLAPASRFGRGVLCVGGLSLLAVAVWPMFLRWHRSWLAEQLTARVAQAADDRVESPIRQLASMGLPAIDSLVAMAASERTAPAFAAQEAISDMVATWEIQAQTLKETSTFSTRLAGLATALAKHADQLSPTGQSWAERLTLRILLHADRLQSSYSLGVLADCQTVLDAVPPRRPGLRNIAITEQPRGTSETPAPLPHAQASPTTSATADRHDATEISSTLPTQHMPTPHAASTLTASEPSGPPSDSHSLEEADHDSGSQSHHQSPRQPSHENLDQSTKRSDSPSLFARQKTVPFRQVVDVPTPEAMAALRRQLQSLPLRELLAKLGKSRGFEAATIRAVARQRGMSDVELALAPWLTSPDANRRLQLLEELSLLQAANSRHWLRWLLDDADGEVRLRALTMMATTGDPRLLDLARTRAVEDTDPRVSELASRILKSRQSR